MVWGNIEMKYRLAIVAASAFVLVACGSKEEENPVTPIPHPVKKVAPADPTADMAIAPADDKKGDGTVIVKYNLPAAPEAGQPIDVELAFLSISDMPAASLAYVAQPGVRLDSDVSGSLPALKEGQIERQKMTITPGAPGVTYVSVTVTTGHAPNSSSRAFSIPLVVSNGAMPPKSPAAQPPKKPA